MIVIEDFDGESFGPAVVAGDVVKAELELAVPGLVGFQLLCRRPPGILNARSEAQALQVCQHPSDTGGKRGITFLQPLSIASLSSLLSHALSPLLGLGE